MTGPRREGWRWEAVWFVLAIALSVPLLGSGVGWGLPSREADGLLFGERRPWTGAEIVALAGGWDAGDKSADGSIGADVQRDGALDRSRPQELNDTDAKRAELVRRWRLYTDQPDEMINLRAFSFFRPGRLELDPRLYQYGGLWFYPAGAVLKGAEAVGGVRLVGDVAFYLDRPDEAGRVYVVLRVIAVVWGISAVAGVFWLSRMIGVGPGLSAVVAVVLAAMPGLVVFAREAKPHVPGMALVVWSLVAGGQYLLTGRARWLGVSAVLAGGAFGMVVSMMPAALVPLGAVAGRAWRTRSAMRSVGVVKGMLWPAGVFLAVYAVTNPYVVRHLLFDRALLFGQVGNSTAMYRVGGGGVDGLVTGFGLLVLMSPTVVLLLPAIGAMLQRRQDERKLGLRRGGTATALSGEELAWLVGPVTVATLGIFVALAAGKPGEFARFGLVVGVAGVLGVAYLSTRFRRAWTMPVSALVFHVMLSGPELARYAADAGPWGERSRAVAGRRMAESEVTRVGMLAEPAPYNTPAFDLWKVSAVLLPRGYGGGADGGMVVLRQPPESDGYWRMSWAGREFGLVREVGEAEPSTRSSGATGAGGSGGEGAGRMLVRPGG